jgi:membrane-bound hydrogenase subunit beta
MLPRNRRVSNQLDANKLQEIVAKTGASIARNRDSTVLTITPDKIRDACKMLVVELPEFYHLSTITGRDTGKAIDVTYHFWSGREFLSVRTSIPKENPLLDSLSDILPSCLLYEAEVKDMLGVLFNGNPLMGRKLLLPDDYPVEAPPPLRKEADPEKIRKMMELE